MFQSSKKIFETSFTQKDFLYFVSLDLREYCGSHRVRFHVHVHAHVYVFNLRKLPDEDARRIPHFQIEFNFGPRIPLDIVHSHAKFFPTEEFLRSLHVVMTRRAQSELSAVSDNGTNSYVAWCAEVHTPDRVTDGAQTINREENRLKATHDFHWQKKLGTQKHGTYFWSEV